MSTPFRTFETTTVLPKSSEQVIWMSPSEFVTAVTSSVPRMPKDEAEICVGCEIEAHR